MQARHKETMEKLDFLQKRGFQVISIYGCEFKRQLATSKNLKKFLSKLSKGGCAHKPLRPRDSLR